MPSNNSYTYYNRFFECLSRFLDRKVEEQKKDKPDKPEKLRKRKWNDISVDTIYLAVKLVIDVLFEKAPSACMGADDWLDKFFIKADGVLCSGMWCGHGRCCDYDGGSPYYCGAGMVPSKCPKWKAWRLGWRSYPDYEYCQKCKHYKPTDQKPSEWTSALQIRQINEYKCYCRAKELPEGCPKKPKKPADKKEVAVKKEAV